MPEESHSALHQGPMGEESPQLSPSLPTSEHEQANVDLGADCCGHLCVELPDKEGERPVSLVSTLSSDSSRDGRSLFGSTATLPSSTTPPAQSEEDIDLELSPPEGTSSQTGDQSPALTGSRGRWHEQLASNGMRNQWNGNTGCSNRKASGETPYIKDSPVITDAMAPNPKLTYVDRVVMEIIETERMYVKDLRSIVEDYLAHIIDMSNLPIRPEQVCALFGNIEDIYEFNSELLQSLDMCDNDPVAIAQCFVDKSEYFEIYTQYCTNYPNSVAALTDCMRNKTLAKFFRDRQASLKRSLPLGSYLLKPVQRILKYHLLLQEIAKHFDPHEEGYEVIQEAIKTMTGVAWYINDMKRKHEHAVRVQEIQSLLINWKGPDLTTYGELALEGTFHVLRAKNTRTLFLFDRMLLITKKRGEHYVYKTHISCSTLMLLDSAKDPLLFSVIHFKHPKQPHTVQAKSVEEKRLWAQHIKRLILENHNAIVPQKAREGTSDISDSPGKYHYSPERLKKTESCHRDEFHLGRRNGRRSSEPAKQLIKNAKVFHAAVLKDDPSGDLAEQKADKSEEVTPPRPEDKEEEMAVEESPTAQTTVADLGPVDSEEQKLDHQVTERCSQSPLSPSSPVPQNFKASESQDSSRETGEDGDVESDSSGLPAEDTSMLSNGGLSEEEEMVLSGNKGILPVSVLDQAGIIAEGFMSSLSRRSSLVSEELAFSSPFVHSPSALEVETEVVANFTPEPQETPLQPEERTLSEGERRSTLSKQDRLLIHKIRRYYEHAEHQDANFSIKRRESLSYIPAGLVRNLSQQLNVGPRDQAALAYRKGQSRNRPTSWAVFDLPGLGKSKNIQHHKVPELKISPVEAKTWSQSGADPREEAFRPSADMLRVWDDMEMAQKGQQIPEEACDDSRTLLDTESDILEICMNEEPPQGPIESENCPPPKESPTSSLRTSFPAVQEEPPQESTTQEKNHFGPAHLPKIVTFQKCAEEDQILEDMGRMKNKVFQLARQYSQRIKNNRPLVWQRNRGTNQQGFKNVPSAQEKSGKPNLRLSISPSDQPLIHDESSLSPVQSPRSASSPEQTLSPSHSMQSDRFLWPDVQELRTKYTSQSSKLNCTAPNGMVKCSTSGCQGCPSHYNSLFDLRRAAADCHRTEALPKRSRGEEDPAQHTLHPPLCRWSSLDHVLGSLPLHEVQNLQDAASPGCTGGQVRLAARENGTTHAEVEALQEGSDCSTKSKLAESHLVKSLREKFQSLSATS
ncbi:pleckstrin homology domain-containing family G member 3 isoform X5 [Takifugu flavidus]|uniref:pleckstrin homology domain-containing family G member 3 isoform X5 n=1 Tax=Takifugu flavidus TaxID=433684 RepID=UPI002544CBAC|nr:pleckstrin homology domain-containing family G member 3 isoform X5 [Takifugu flavidus]